MNKIVITLFLSGFMLCATAQETKTPVEFVKIIDGDTITVKIEDNEFPVRLEGIDCFESIKNQRIYKQAYINKISVEEVMEKGLDSKKYLEKLYKNSNKKVYFVFKGLDYYKRALGIVYFDDLNVNDALLEHGGCMKL